MNSASEESPCVSARLCTYRSFPNLRSDLQQQAQWRAALERLPASTRIGFLHLDAAPLKEALMPVTQQAIEQVRSRSFSSNVKTAQFMFISLAKSFATFAILRHFRGGLGLAGKSQAAGIAPQQQRIVPGEAWNKGCSPPKGAQAA